MVGQRQQLPQRIQRGWIGPVNVLANQHQRLALRQGCEVAPHADQQLVLERLAVQGSQAAGLLPLELQPQQMRQVGIELYGLRAAPGVGVTSRRYARRHETRFTAVLAGQ
jgi:hypothetical protein